MLDRERGSSRFCSENSITPLRGSFALACAAPILHINGLFVAALLASALLNWAAILLSTLALAQTDAWLVSPLLTFNPTFTLLLAWFTGSPRLGLEKALFHLATSELTHLLTAYGYWAMLVFVAVESTGIPFPGETMLLVAAIYAGTTHQLSLVLVIAAAAGGAILGDNLGYWVGREGGYRLLRRYGRLIRLEERRLKLGQYLFLRHGGKVVFFGRFVAVLRAWAAFLAGTNRMSWTSFLRFNALGGIVWASIYGVGGYFLGENVHQLAGPLGTLLLVLAVLVILGVLLFARQNERRLEDEAERALPGPLNGYQLERARDKNPV